VPEFLEGIERAKEGSAPEEESGEREGAELGRIAGTEHSGDPESQESQGVEKIQEMHRCGVSFWRDAGKVGLNLAGMKKLLRKVMLAMVLAVLGVVILGWMARKCVTEEMLTRMAEGQINSRVQIGTAKLNLFRFPATITLREVLVSERDGEVAKEVAERTPLVPDAVPVRVKEVRLAVSLLALLKQRVEIKAFVFREPRLTVTLLKEGGNSLDDLLKTPGGRKKEGRAREEVNGAGKKKDDEVLNTKSLNIHAHGFLGRINEFRLENASLDLIVEKTGMAIKVRDFNVQLDQIDLDPSALEKTNAARAQIAARVEIDSADGMERYALIGFEGPAEVKLFDPVSGDLDLDIRGDFQLSARTYLSTKVPVVEKAWEALQKLDIIGVKIGELPEKAITGRSKSVALHYHQERFLLTKPISLWFKDWELAMLEGTWLQTEQAVHLGNIELIAEEQLSGKLRMQIGRGVDYIPSKFRPILLEEVEETWFRNGRLMAQIKTKGDLSSPSVDLRNKFPDLKALAKKAGEKLLEGGVENLLEGILGN
jgi:hypothetical protein